jgi:hypothetical protein
MPETLCGMVREPTRVALELAKSGALVVIPQVVSRQREARSGRAIMTDQEYLYRSAFVLGRHLLGYHVQQCMAAVDVLQGTLDSKPIVIAGWGEGGWVALAAAASDPRIDAALVSGHFGPREGIWNEPIHRNVHGLLSHFGDAQLAALVAPRALDHRSDPWTGSRDPWTRRCAGGTRGSQPRGSAGRDRVGERHAGTLGVGLQRAIRRSRTASGNRPPQPREHRTACWTPSGSLRRVETRL